MQSGVVQARIGRPVSMHCLRLVHIGQCEITLMKQLAFTVAVFPMEFVVFERVGRELSGRIASRGDFKAAGLVPAQIFPFGLQRCGSAALFPCVERRPALAIFVHHAVVDVAFHMAGPEIAVRFVVLIAVLSPTRCSLAQYDEFPEPVAARYRTASW